MKYSSSELSATVELDRLGMLIVGGGATGGTRVVSLAAGAEDRSRGEMGGSGVALTFFLFTPVGSGFPGASTGGRGRPFQPRSRSLSTS